MILKQLKPRKALNKAYLKLKPNRDKIDVFKTNLIQLLDRIDDTTLEPEIDQLVYELYGLTKEEIEIVEGA